jgi:hypothetical protein
MSSTSTPRLAEDAAKPLVWMPWNTFSTVERSTTAEGQMYCELKSGSAVRNAGVPARVMTEGERS